MGETPPALAHHHKPEVEVVAAVAASGLAPMLASLSKEPTKRIDHEMAGTAQMAVMPNTNCRLYREALRLWSLRRTRRRRGRPLSHHGRKPWLHQLLYRLVLTMSHRNHRSRLPANLKSGTSRGKKVTSAIMKSIMTVQT